MPQHHHSLTINARNGAAEDKVIKGPSLRDANRVARALL